MLLKIFSVYRNENIIFKTKKSELTKKLLYMNNIDILIYYCIKFYFNFNLWRQAFNYIWKYMEIYIETVISSIFPLQFQYFSILSNF